ncbi:MAG: glycosyltransferase family 39 protein [Elusimicrobia bacterium]|nr:glycosyltransferase family 39 protein [Elusimicrobiota bacterium]
MATERYREEVPLPNGTGRNRRPIDAGNARRRAQALAVMIAVLAAAAALRLIGIRYGLPAVFNADEPHHVNVAVSFGRGSLNPGVFKYPTLWMYALFIEYGFYFILWSGFGLARSLSDFGALFAWHPGGFYLLGRLLSAACSLAGVLLACRAAGRLFGGMSALWAAALLAASPTAAVSAHAAKPDSMMFCLSAAAWVFAARFFEGGKPRDLALAGLFSGLAASTQYTAAPLLALIPAAAWARALARGESARGLLKPAALAALVFAAGFLAGSPFILLDWRSFMRDALDQRGVVGAGSPVGAVVLKNALTFAGHWAVGGLLLICGAFRLLRSDRPRAALLLIPAAAFLALLACSPEGAWQRYQLAVFPAYAAAAAYAVEWLPARLASPLLAFVLLLPGGRQSWAYATDLRLDDTRTLAAAWIESSLPEGTRILTDQEHSSPLIRMCRREVSELLERTRSEGHPRWRYYELMLRSHPGGGFEALRILRSAADLRSGAWHAGWSARGRATVDVLGGLAAARAAGVEVVALTSDGVEATGAPEYARFLRETRSAGALLAEFSPEPGLRRGPMIEIYRIAGANP